MQAGPAMTTGQSGNFVLAAATEGLTIFPRKSSFLYSFLNNRQKHWHFWCLHRKRRLAKGPCAAIAFVIGNAGSPLRRVEGAYKKAEVMRRALKA